MKNGGLDHDIIETLKAPDFHRYIQQFPMKMCLEWRSSRNGDTLLHRAIYSGDRAALVALILAGFSPTAEKITGLLHDVPTLIEQACYYNQSECVRILIAVGFSISNSMAFAIEGESISCCRTLIANGVSLNGFYNYVEKRFIRKLYSFEQQVKRCRKVVFAILASQKLGRIHVGCKYAAREIAFAIWATREDEEWGFSR
jgi:hypothetical protein